MRSAASYILHQRINCTVVQFRIGRIAKKHFTPAQYVLRMIKPSKRATSIKRIAHRNKRLLLDCALLNEHAALNHKRERHCIAMGQAEIALLLQKCRKILNHRLNALFAPIIYDSRHH